MRKSIQVLSLFLMSISGSFAGSLTSSALNDFAVEIQNDCPNCMGCHCKTQSGHELDFGAPSEGILDRVVKINGKTRAVCGVNANTGLVECREM